jgi:hypothetical protein
MSTQQTCLTLALCLGATALVPGAATAQTNGRAVSTYIVQLAEPPAATYSGGIQGLAATRVAPGKRLNARAPATQAYRSHLLRRQQATLAALGPGVRPLMQYTVVMNGYAVKLTQSQARQLKTQANVVSVERAGMSRVTTYSTPEFLGLTAPGGLWSTLAPDSQPVKGEDVIVGIIDTGVWPENPSMGDKVDASGAPVPYHLPGVPAYGPAPAGWAGVCQTGPGFTAAMCGGKLIGARFYPEGYQASGIPMSPMEYLSPRDGAGHGSHVAATAAGNAGAPASLNGVDVARVSGVAPRARVAAYKVCWEAADPQLSGCSHADMVRALEDAVTDGVHVINMSISGPTTVAVDPLSRALLNANTAGVFVAVAAGNSGPYVSVNHVAPWVTTVAASTDDRSYQAELALGNALRLRGVSVTRRTVPDAPLVLGASVALPGQADGGLCRPGSLSPALAAGRVVVCDRSNDITRLEKSAEVKRVGGVGMVLVNTVADNLLPDAHSVPTVHLPHTARDSLRTYAGSTAAQAGMVPVGNSTPVAAPVMAQFSSRGPNLGLPNIMKPDITAPGVNIVAAFIDPAQTQAEHDALVIGNHTGRSAAATLSGTSMASPHVAGAAALLRQMHPQWSVAAIKSAMQTSASAVKRANGTPDTDVWGYGAGHLNPNGAGAVPLVYDLTPEDYGRFLCGLNLDPGSLGSCVTLGSITPSDLNLGSLSGGATTDRVTMRRSVTNVSGAHGVFLASVNMPGWTVTVTPSQLSLPAGARGEFTVDMVAQTTAPMGLWSVGSLTWSDGLRSIRSPLLAQLNGFRVPALVVDKRRVTSARKVYTVVPGQFSFTQAQPNGLLPATLTPGRAEPGKAVCTDITVTEGAEVLRVQLFNADTEGGSATDLNLQLFQGSGGVGPMVGASALAGSDEALSLLEPAAGTYSACVVSAAVPTAGAAYTLSSWVLSPGAGSSMQALSPGFMVAGSPASIALSWQAALGQRYLGRVKYLDGGVPQAAMTQVLVDTR